MNKVTLGNSELNVSKIGLGCMGMSEFYGPHDEAESIKVIHRALELGVNFFDTADMYGVGHNEKLLKKAFVDAGKRDQAVIATKFGIGRTDDGGWTGVHGSPEYVKKSCEASLQRLGLDYIDLYYQHRVDPVVPIEETIGAMAELVKEGKVKYIGLSEANAGQIRKASAVHPISALQTEYSMWERHIEDEVLPTCRELGISFVAYSPLGRGILTGAIKKMSELDKSDYRHHVGWYQDGNFDKNMSIVAELQAIAEEKGATLAQLALAWVSAQGDDVLSIPGTKRIKYLEDNVKASDVTLTADDLTRIEMATKAVAGQR